MTKQQVRKKTRELIREPSNAMKANLEKVLNQHMVDWEKWEDNYRLSRIIFQALLDEEKFQYKPTEKDSKKLIQQIYTQL